MEVASGSCVMVWRHRLTPGFLQLVRGRPRGVHTTVTDARGEQGTSRRRHQPAFTILVRSQGRARHIRVRFRPRILLCSWRLGWAETVTKGHIKPHRDIGKALSYSGFVERSSDATRSCARRGRVAHAHGETFVAAVTLPVMRVPRGHRDFFPKLRLTLFRDLFDHQGKQSRLALQVGIAT